MKKKGLIGLISTLSLAGVTAVASVGIGLANHKNAGDNSDDTSKSYTVTYVMYDGEGNRSEKIGADRYLTEPSASRSGYEFLGWCTDEQCTNFFDFSATPITSDITLYAKWGVKYTVTFDTCGGSRVEPELVAEGSKLSRPSIPGKAEYGFVGWYTDAEYSEIYDFNQSVLTNVTLYAKWLQLDELYQFTSVGYNQYEISKFLLGESNISELSIPSTYRGGVVNKIGNSAFSSCSNLISITIPSTVTSVGHGAFYSCTSLTTIEIPYSVTSVGVGVFTFCSNLTSITIPDGVTTLGSGLFANCSNLTSITIPSSITNIQAGVFHSSGITSIIIPNGTTVTGNAFTSCSNLATIYLESDSIPSDWAENWKDSCDAQVLLYGTDWEYDENHNPVEIIK